MDAAENMELSATGFSKNKKLITATDIDNSYRNVEKTIDEKVIQFNKKRIKAALKSARELRRIDLNDSTYTLTKEEIQQIGLSIISDEKTKEFIDYQKQNVNNQKNNYNELRSTINDLNDLNEFSAEIEKHQIQTVEDFLPFDKLIKLSSKRHELLQQMMKSRRNSINEKVELMRKEKLSSSDGLSLLLKIREMYRVSTGTDDIELYEKYDMQTNIDFAHQLSDVCFKSNDSNLINAFIPKSLNARPDLVEHQIVSNKFLGVLLSENFISNNRVTCYDNAYVNNMKNTKIYTTRTIGELLYAITDEDRKFVEKSLKEQIYCVYDGKRPSKEEYHNWNGLQIYDIDLKLWNGNIDLLKKKLHEFLGDFHWYLWICKSASGKGLHIYTKVSPPHHVYLDINENEYISKYWYNVNYITKLSNIYDCLYRLGKTNQFSFDEPFENVFVDNSVGRITSGIRLTYDENPLINPNFVDLHVGLGLGQTIDGYYYQETIDRVLLKIDETRPYNKKIIEHINKNLAVEKIDDYRKRDKEPAIDLSKYVSLGGDLSNLTPLPRTSINYMVRYNVCNTLASLFGKDGLELAHVLLDSKVCKNVGEINSFYSCAISNKKEPSKMGLEILKRAGIIKSVAQELVDNTEKGFKAELKQQIEKTLSNDLLLNTIELGANEYLSDVKTTIVQKLTGDKINIILSPPGSGKCLGKDTGVLMFDGSTKMVQDIKAGDLLMGLDSTPRRVLSTTMGQEELYRVTPNKGEPWVCNKSHILSVIETGVFKSSCGLIPNNRDIQDIGVTEMMEIQEKRKNHGKKLFRVPLNFPEKKIYLAPYFLGLWLGDGRTDGPEIAVGDIDKDVTVPFLEFYAKQLGCSVTRYQDFREGHNVSSYRIVSGTRKVESKIFKLMRHYNLIDNKHIPKDYLMTDRKTRLLLFAGLIDSDGGGSDGTYDYVTKLPNLADDIQWLCRSLGYYVNRTTKFVDGTPYQRLMISGNFSDLPVRIVRKRFNLKKPKNNLVSGFKLESIGIGDYYGFEIDGDKRFMLSDFTVTHNTELIKQLAKDGKRVLLVLPYISVIKNKIETDSSITENFDTFYGSSSINDLQYGRNAVTTFDKFSRSNYEKLSKMFDYVFIDESHLLFTSSYRIEATSNAVKKLKELFFISSNDPFAAKLCLFTGTETGESYFFSSVANIIRVSKKMQEKRMEFLICDDLLDATTRLAAKTAELISEQYKIMIPTNKGELYTEKLIGMIEYLVGRPIKYGYYKRSNNEQELCRMINENNTVGDYDIVFCSNYLSVGVDINDNEKFASIYLGNFSGYEIEQFNARIRKTGIRSIYCIITNKADGTTNDILLDEPNLVLRITEDDQLFFIDDKAIASAKNEFIATYDPVLQKITTPGFAWLNGKIQFNPDEYDLLSFENKYNECMQHPIKVSRELSKYSYTITVSTQFEGLDIKEQEALKKMGIEAAKQEKIRKHNLLVGTFTELIKSNNFVNEHGLEFNDVIGWIGKNGDKVEEDRELMDSKGEVVFIQMIFDVFATPVKCIVRSREALEKMYKPAKYLAAKYSKSKAIDVIMSYVDDNGILKQKAFQRSISLLKLIDSSEACELAEPLTNIIEKMYDFVDKFENNSDMKISYNTYQTTIETWTNNYIDSLGIRINTMYGFKKLQDGIVEMLQDIATRSKSKNGIRFSYNKMPEQDNSNILNRRSVDSLVQNMFNITADVSLSNTNNKIKSRHLMLQNQNF